MRFFNKCLAHVELNDGNRMDCFSLFFTRPEETWKRLRLTKIMIDDKTYQILARYQCEWILQDGNIVGVKLEPLPESGLSGDLAKLNLEDVEEEGAPEEKSDDDDDEEGPGGEGA